MGDDDPVTFGRWQAEHAALAARVGALEERVTRGRDRSWALILTVLGGLALPILTVAVLAAFHRASS